VRRRNIHVRRVASIFWRLVRRAGRRRRRVLGLDDIDERMCFNDGNNSSSVILNRNKIYFNLLHYTNKYFWIAKKANMSHSHYPLLSMHHATHRHMNTKLVDLRSHAQYPRECTMFERSVSTRGAFALGNTPLPSMCTADRERQTVLVEASSTLRTPALLVSDINTHTC
jgi:hypothetical protein